MNVLVACEFSGIVREAFRARGHNAISVDLLPSEQPGPHFQMPIEQFLEGFDIESIDLLIAHPPCTYLTNAGVRHLHESVSSRNGIKAKVHGAARWEELKKAIEFFNLFKNLPVPRIAIENPIPHKYAKEGIGNYSQIIQPWQFGHKETKSTCLWLKNLPELVPTNIVGPPPKNMTSGEKRSWHRVHYTSPGINRGKERSRFFIGIAEAMADQWAPSPSAFE